MKNLKLIVILSIIHILGCNKMNTEPESQSLEGTWVLEELLVDSEIIEAMPPQSQFNWTTIEINFPDSLQAGAWGHTYNNEY